MAIKYKEIATKHKKIQEAPLTEEEINYVDKIESYIDDKITSSFNNDKVSIDLLIASFEWNPFTKDTRTIEYKRRVKMQQELEKRYKKAGWKIKIVLDEGLDGPNFQGPDYWILSGK